ncbi:MAG: hypothetical protein QM673_15735 [Gordonia sp. (in: high G+C Gram-positive bacteria)]
MAAQAPRQQLPFAVVMRGFDREQVTERLQRIDAEMRVLAADRDAATANAQELAAHLHQARDQIEALRREVDTLSVPPTTAQGMSDRLSRMLQLASDEASEMRAEASAEAAETLSVARQESQQLTSDAQAEADRILADARERSAQTVAQAHAEATRLREEAAALHAEATAAAEEDARLRSERRAAMESEHTTTMAAAHDEAAHIRDKARAEADQLARENAQTIAEQHRIALEEATRIRDTAHEIAIERLSRSRELAVKADDARIAVLAQFAEIQQKLAAFPDILRPSADIDYTGGTAADEHELLNRVLSERAQLDDTHTSSE